MKFFLLLTLSLLAIGPPVRAGAISQDFYSKTHSVLKSLYQDDVKLLRGDTLKFADAWEDDDTSFQTFFGSEEEIKQAASLEITIYLSGGLARYTRLTPDAFLLAACHEIGHILGGYPYYRSDQTQVIKSNEGAADYFAASKCFKKALRADPENFKPENEAVPAFVSQSCQAAGFRGGEANECERTELAGLNLAQVLRVVHPRHEEALEAMPEFSKSEKMANRILEHHTSPQCRLDTFVAGATCKVPVDALISVVKKNGIAIDWSKEVDLSGSCARELGDTQGIRPACWFR